MESQKTAAFLFRVNGFFEKMKAIEEEREDCFASDPVSVLSSVIGISRPTAVKYIEHLEGMGKVDVLRTDGGAKRRGTIRSLIIKASAPVVKEAVAAPPAMIVSPPVPVVPVAVVPSVPAIPAAVAAGVVVLLDYENVRLHAREKSGSDAQLNFVELMARCVREFGQVLRAEAFLPPHLAASEPVIRALLAAGFIVVHCPMRCVDKDDADNVLCESAEFHFGDSRARKVVIVSADRGFRRLSGPAARAGKEVIYLNLFGDGLVEDSSRLVERNEKAQFYRAFEEAISASAGQELSARAKFLHAIAGEVAKQTKAADDLALRSGSRARYLSFKPLAEKVEAALSAEWKSELFFRSLGDALSVLVKKGVVMTIEASNFVAYKITNDALLRRMFLDSK